MVFYKITESSEQHILNNYKKDLPSLILKDYLLFLPAFVLVLIGFCFTDVLFRNKPELIFTRILPIVFSILLIIVKLSSYKNNYLLVVILNDLLCISTLLMGFGIVIIAFNTDFLKSAITALVIVMVLVMVVVKGIRSIIVVYSVPLLLFLLYILLVIKPPVSQLQELMNPIALYIAILFITIRQEMARFQKYYFESKLKSAVIRTDELYKDTLKKNNELSALNDHLVQTKISLEKAINSKNLLFSIISHDLRSPFNALLGYTNILTNKGTNLPASEMVSILNKLKIASDKTYKLVHDLLEWSVLQTGSLGINKQMYSIKDVVNQSIELLLTQAKNKKIEIIIECNSELQVLTDPNIISTIIRNLVTNAIKFSFQESKVWVTVQQRIKGYDICVKDQGIGMTQEKADKIFDIKKNQSTKGTNNEEGIGLGLYICKELVELLEGMVKVNSNPNEGTEFVLTF